VRETLRCGPPAGNVYNPAFSCAQLRSRARVLFARPGGTTCFGGIFYTDVSLTGKYRGRRIDRLFDHCADGRAIDAWERALRLTRLDVTVVSGGRSHAMELVCNPSGGTVADPARSCRSLARDPELLARRPERRCGPGHQDAIVNGMYRGRDLSVFVSCREPRIVRRWIELLLGFYTPSANGT
jgi:hypothetical protein